MKYHAAFLKKEVVLDVQKWKETKDLFLNARHRASKQHLYYDPFVQVQKKMYCKTKSLNGPHKTIYITLARKMRLEVRWRYWICNEEHLLFFF